MIRVNLKFPNVVGQYSDMGGLGLEIKKRCRRRAAQRS